MTMRDEEKEEEPTPTSAASSACFVSSVSRFGAVDVEARCITFGSVDGVTAGPTDGRTSGSKLCYLR